MSRKNPSTNARTSRTTVGYALIGASALGVLAAINAAVVARAAERNHPPTGRFDEVDGVRLHYTDRGNGRPVVLLHGNAVTGSDWETSGVSGLLAHDHRINIFDRPGFGFSDRPRGRLWTGAQQADLLHKAVQQLGVERPVIALSLASRYEADIAGLVLVSGYYFWTLRPDVLLVAPGAILLLGDVLRYTVLPLLGWLQMPALQWAMFSPGRVPVRSLTEYSPA